MQLKVQVCILVSVGILLIVGSVIFQQRFAIIFEDMLNNKLILRPGSKTLESFKSPPVPIFMQFWFFNVTNSRDVITKGSTPLLKQVGPYTYEEKQLKYDLTFDDHAGTVTYVQNKTFFFREDLSQGHTERDHITTINAVMMTLASKFETLPDVMKGLIELWFVRFNVEPFVTRPVKELLFEGYKDPLLEKVTSLKGPVKKRFGFFFPRNNSNDGYYTIKTGSKGMSDYQNIVSWKGQSSIDYWKRDLWKGDTCNMINGTGGNQFATPLQKDRPLHLYTNELCRSIYVEFQKEVSHGKLTLYRYILPSKLLADTPENRCFCSDDFTCRASMIDVSPCRDGAPVVMSTPHFFHGDPEDIKQVIGLDPKEEEHETYLDIEPTTGVTFRAAKRIQLNIPLRRYSNFPSFKNVPDVILPVLWVNESAVVPLERSAAVYRTLTLPFTLVQVATVILIIVGVILFLVALFKILRAAKTQRQKSPQPMSTANNRKGKVVDKEQDINASLYA